MNYRHSFHAGNFADLVKHALVLWLLRTRQVHGPVAVLDTHAGAGLYDLTGDATRSGEAEAGVARLMASFSGRDRRPSGISRPDAAEDGLPPLVQALADQVRAVNPGGRARFYPGSPVLVARALRADDRYLGFELREEIQTLLVESLASWPEAQGVGGDGFEAVLEAARAATAPLVLIDPPYERPDDYVRAAETTAALMRADPGTTVAIWTPLKDMETFDGFIRRLEGVGPTQVAEARLRPLSNPMTMNGCAMVVVNPPAGGEAAAAEICGWVARTLGQAGAKAEVWRT